MNRAFDDLFGIPGAFDDIPMAGRTDRGILDDGAARAGVDLSGDNFERFRDRYFARLLEALPEPGPTQGVLPGVRPLLDAIARARDIFPAPAHRQLRSRARASSSSISISGNSFAAARLATTVTDRNDLFDVAMHTRRACGAPRVTPADVIVVGDTVLDVACAQAAGARSVAVATGPFDVETLQGALARIWWCTTLSDTDALPAIVSVQI